MPTPKPAQIEFPEALGAILDGVAHGAAKFVGRVANAYQAAEARRQQLRIDRPGVGSDGQLDLGFDEPSDGVLEDWDLVRDVERSQAPTPRLLQTKLR